MSSIGDNEIVVGRVIRENDGKPVRAWLKNYDYGYWDLGYCSKVVPGTNCPFEDSDGEPYAFCLLYQKNQMPPGEFVLWSFGKDADLDELRPGMISDDGVHVITITGKRFLLESITKSGRIYRAPAWRPIHV